MAKWVQFSITAFLIAIATFVFARSSYAVSNKCDFGGGVFFNVGQAICNNQTEKSVCQQPDPTKDADWVDVSCAPSQCTGADGSAKCLNETFTPTPTLGAEFNCTVNTGPLGDINPPITMAANQVKCIQNAKVTCTNGQPYFASCGDDFTCKETGSTVECVAGAPPTASLVEGGQIVPQPGTNCGVARFKDKAERDAAIARGEDPESFADACCYTKIQSSLEIPKLGEVPVVGGIVNTVIDFVNTNIVDALPFVIINKVLPLPTVGSIKKGFDEINKQLCVGGPTFANGTPGKKDCKCYGGNFSGLAKYCQNSPVDAGKCTSCFQAGGIYTSIGCISDISNVQSLVATVFNVGLGLAGGFAFMCIIYAAFLLQTSGGSPDRVKKSKELMTSCITGLLLIIFSIFILRLIGVQILKIPGFT